MLVARRGPPRFDTESVPYRIVERGIGVTLEERDDFGRVVECLGAHRELSDG
jgi:hypothetical protein